MYPIKCQFMTAGINAFVLSFCSNYFFILERNMSFRSPLYRGAQMRCLCCTHALGSDRPCFLLGLHVILLTLKQRRTKESLKKFQWLSTSTAGHQPDDEQQSALHTKVGHSAHRLVPEYWALLFYGVAGNELGQPANLNHRLKVRRNFKEPSWVHK